MLDVREAAWLAVHCVRGLPASTMGSPRLLPRTWVTTALYRRGGLRPAASTAAGTGPPRAGGAGRRTSPGSPPAGSRPHDNPQEAGQADGDNTNDHDPHAQE